MRKAILVALLIAAGFVGGFGYGRWYGPRNGAAAAVKPAERKILYWVDPMHPAYTSDKPGTAPDCGMALVPVYEEKAAGVTQPPGTIQVSPEKQQLMGVKFAVAEYTTTSETLRAAGKVAIDETRVVRVHPKVEGWIERVHVDFVGQQVKKGDPLLTVYSPEMLASEKEYLLALKARELVKVEMNSDSLVAASRKRLELWDFSGAQLDELERTKTPISSITIYSPAAGFIMARNSFSNQRISPETELYAIADLSRVWIMAELFEADIAKIGLGHAAMVKMPYGGGASFLAKVDYLQPQVDPQTRTVKVRLDAPNPGMKLKPDMFVDVEFPIGGARQLTVPADAVINAGLRQTVFVDRENGYLEPRSVTTGDESGGRVAVLTGLKAGERVATGANFLLDSESQLKAPVAGAAK